MEHKPPRISSPCHKISIVSLKGSYLVIDNYAKDGGLGEV